MYLVIYSFANSHVNCEVASDNCKLSVASMLLSFFPPEHVADFRNV